VHIAGLRCPITGRKAPLESGKKLSQPQIRMIKELLQTSHDFMEVGDFAIAYQKAFQHHCEADENSADKFDWHCVMQAIHFIASIRFGRNGWHRALDALQGYPGVTVKRMPD
jgi:hypothetical protein